MQPIQQGKYQHYKGQLYQVLGQALHTETKQELVVYQPLYEVPEGDIFFVRPKSMFLENVEVDSETGKVQVPRFKLISITINDTVYGKQEISDPAALEIINTPEMQRLKEVSQNGTWQMFYPEIKTSRFDHCVGVYLLLRKLGAPQQEQIAGLIHDIAHTAFSHVVDYAFQQSSSQTFHEEFHQQIVMNSKIPKILKKHGMKPEFILNEKNFPLLEQDLPQLCADRVDYFFRDALAFGAKNQEDVNRILNSLTVENNEISLDDELIAKEIAEGFIELCKNFWANHLQVGAYQYLADVIKQGLQENVISKNDLFLSDKGLLNKMKQDPFTAHKLSLISNKAILVGDENNYTYHTTSKARYVNPQIVKQENGNKTVERTFTLYPEFVNKVEQLKKRNSEGFYVKIVENQS